MSLTSPYPAPPLKSLSSFPYNTFIHNRPKPQCHVFPKPSSRPQDALRFGGGQLLDLIYQQLLPEAPHPQSIPDNNGENDGNNANPNTNANANAPAPMDLDSGEPPFSIWESSQATVGFQAMFSLAVALKRGPKDYFFTDDLLYRYIPIYAPELQKNRGFKEVEIGFQDNEKLKDYNEDGTENENDIGNNVKVQQGWQRVELNHRLEEFGVSSGARLSSRLSSMMGVKLWTVIRQVMNGDNIFVAGGSILAALDGHIWVGSLRSYPTDIDIFCQIQQEPQGRPDNYLDEEVDLLERRWHPVLWVLKKLSDPQSRLNPSFLVRHGIIEVVFPRYVSNRRIQIIPFFCQNPSSPFELFSSFDLSYSRAAISASFPNWKELVVYCTRSFHYSIRSGNVVHIKPTNFRKDRTDKVTAKGFRLILPATLSEDLSARAFQRVLKRIDNLCSGYLDGRIDHRVQNQPVTISNGAQSNTLFISELPGDLTARTVFFNVRAQSQRMFATYQTRHNSSKILDRAVITGVLFQDDGGPGIGMGTGGKKSWIFTVTTSPGESKNVHVTDKAWTFFDSELSSSILDEDSTSTQDEGSIPIPLDYISKYEFPQASREWNDLFPRADRFLGLKITGLVFVEEESAGLRFPPFALPIYHLAEFPLFELPKRKSRSYSAGERKRKRSVSDEA